jgi:hypothetical protein
MPHEVSVHESVDMARWIEQFPLERHWEQIESQDGPDFWYNVPNDIFSPRDLALTEQLRARAALQALDGNAIAVDLLLPAWGEPRLAFASKVGGIPYLRRGEWPMASNGKPFLFLAQLCFADSKDLLPKLNLPADVLLIFCEDSDEMIESSSAGARLHFEWRHMGIPRKQLMQVEDMPRPTTWTPTHFQRYRSFETKRTGHVAHPRCTIEVSGRYVSSKIGGLPAYIQSDEEAVALGAYLASLHSINPADRVYPFPNLPEAPWTNPWDGGLLMFGDVGTLYLYASGYGDINWLMQCS